MYQGEYASLYQRLLRYAESRARLYFKDSSLFQDAVFEAIDRFVDGAGFVQVGENLTYNPEILDLEAWGKTVIINSLKNSSKKKREIEPVNEVGRKYNGFQGYKIK